MSNEKIRQKISFLAKEPTVCPICETQFFKENLLTGSGRLIAGEITDTFHRLYIPSQAFGKIYPLVYPAVVCPDCFFRVFI